MQQMFNILLSLVKHVVLLYVLQPASLASKEGMQYRVFQKS